MARALDTVARNPLQRIDPVGWLRRLPLPLQAALSVALGALFLLNVALPDLIPLLDEVAIGWALYMSVSATAASVRERQGLTAGGAPHRAVAPRSSSSLPDLGRADLDELDPDILAMTLREMEHLDPALVQEAIAELEG